MGVIHKVIKDKVSCCCFPIPLQFGARDLGFSFLGGSVEADARGLNWPEVWKMSQIQTEYTNNLDMKWDDRPDETMDSGIVTLLSCGAGPALESMLSDTMMDLWTMDADASTPFLGHNHHFGPRSVVRPRLFGHDLLNLIPEEPPPSTLSPPPPRSQPGTDFVSQQLAERMADLTNSSRSCRAKIAHWSWHRLLCRHRPRGPSRFDIGQLHLLLWKSRSFAERLVGTSTDRHLTLLFGRMGGTTIQLPYSSYATWRGTRWMLRSWCWRRKEPYRPGWSGRWMTITGLPRRLADYRRQFEKTVRQDGEDPSIFAIELETLDVKAFRDMGPSALIRLILDRFIAIR